jgi:prevent-host-death family protein
MKRATLKEVGERLDELVEEVRRGETIVIVENGSELARLTPPENGRAVASPANGASNVDWEAKLADLERRGRVRRSKISEEERAAIVARILERPRSEGPSGALAALLEERREGR